MLRLRRRGPTPAETGVEVYTNWDEFVPDEPDPLGPDADDSARHPGLYEFVSPMQLVEHRTEVDVNP